MTDELYPDELTPDEESPLPMAQAAAAAGYHVPPDIIPRDAMWSAIQARRGRDGSSGTDAPPATIAPVAPSAGASPDSDVVVLHTRRSALSRYPQLPRWIAAAAAAAVVVFGINLARGNSVESSGTVAVTSAVVDSAATPASNVWQVASTEHFGRAETMLTTLAESPETSGDRELTAWSRDLLESTRLLMDSPAGRDPRRRALLQELELVLVQLVESGPALRTEDRSVMDELLTKSSLLLTRIRTTVPAGIPASHN